MRVAFFFFFSDGGLKIGFDTGFVVPTVVTTMEPGLSRSLGVEVERAVPEVWCSSQSGSQSGEGVTVLRSLDDRPHSGRTLDIFLS